MDQVPDLIAIIAGKGQGNDSIDIPCHDGTEDFIDVICGVEQHIITQQTQLFFDKADDLAVKGIGDHGILIFLVGMDNDSHHFVTAVI